MVMKLCMYAHELQAHDTILMRVLRVNVRLKCAMLCI